MKFISLLFGFFLSLSSVSLANERIISIGGDVTEIIYALNAEQNLVARDSTSTTAAAKSLPDIGYMRKLNAEGLLSLKPTLILASSVAEPAVVLEQVKNLGVNVVTIPYKYDEAGLIHRIQLIAQTLNKTDKAQTLIQQLQSQLAQVPSTSINVKALFLMNPQNGTVGGNRTVADYIIQRLGATNAAHTISRYGTFSTEEMINANPDLIIIGSAAFARLDNNPENLWKIAGLSMTNAGKNNAYVVVDSTTFLGFGIHIANELQKIRSAMENIAQTKP